MAQVQKIFYKELKKQIELNWSLMRGTKYSSTNTTTQNKVDNDFYFFKSRPGFIRHCKSLSLS